MFLLHAIGLAGRHCVSGEEGRSVRVSDAFKIALTTGQSFIATGNIQYPGGPDQRRAQIAWLRGVSIDGYIRKGVALLPLGELGVQLGCQTLVLFVNL